MSDFSAKSVCILGRQPALGLAELESLYGAEHIQPIEEAALLDIEAADINFKRLGGTLKVAKVLTVLNTITWSGIEKYLVDNIPSHLQHLPAGKFTLGLSVYNLPVATNDINKTALRIKKIVKSTGRPVRVVPNNERALNSAQVLHNQLTRRGAWELLLIKNQNQTILAQTFFVQDIDAYAARDQARPKRDARVGMLPPKLAQMIVNLAVGQIEPTVDSQQLTVLDPFCGTGVILQETLLMGYMGGGTDKDPRMVDFSRKNLEWLKDKFQPRGVLKNLEVADATNHRWKDQIDAVATETYLGQPFSAIPSPEKLHDVIQDVNTILKKFLKNIGPQLAPDTPLCLAVPAWRLKKETKHLPLIDQLTEMGYTYLNLKHVPREELIYFREDQVVARQLLRIKKV
jgi:tRNA G10  N-methylase Trm11